VFGWHFCFVHSFMFSHTSICLFCNPVKSRNGNEIIVLTRVGIKFLESERQPAESGKTRADWSTWSDSDTHICGLLENTEMSVNSHI